MADDEVFLKVQDRAQKVRDLYQESASRFSNVLLYGDFGTGKTSIAATAPTPVFIDSFDPGGTKTFALQEKISAGDIIVDNRWETDSWKDPFAFRDWEREMDARKREGFFDHIGTYMLDSATRWSDSLMFEIFRREGRKGKNPQIQDYLVQQLTAVDWLGVMMGLPCHVIVTGHIGYDKDEVTGKMETGLLMYGKLSGKVPLVFDEKWISTANPGKDGSEYLLQVHNDGYKKAETRMGGVKFADYEQPDLKHLLRKAGRDPSDKPSLFAEHATIHNPG